MRLSRIMRNPEDTGDADALPVRRILLWSVVGIAILAGLALYFKYGRQLSPLLG